jgi:ribosomal protein L37AE/L43A
MKKKERYHANGKIINEENPQKSKRCPKCKSSNTFKNGNIWDCKFCGELFY